MPITLQSVTVLFNHNLPTETTALDNINLTLNDNECLAITGKSGSGKSTLGLVISGLIKPSSGIITNIFNAADTEIGVNYAPQFPEKTFFCDTVAAELRYALERRNIAEDVINARVAKAMQCLGLEVSKYSHKRPMDLSGGEARRLGLAFTAIWDSNLYVFDEPTMALDKDGFELVVDYLLSLKANGKTIVIISQDAELIEALSDRVVLLESGNILWEGQFKDIFQSAFWRIHPLSPTEGIINTST